MKGKQIFEMKELHQDTKIKVTATANYCPARSATSIVRMETIPEWNLTISRDSICEKEEVTLSSDFPYTDGLIWEDSTCSTSLQLIQTGDAELKDNPVVSTCYMVKAQTMLGCAAGEKYINIHVDESIDKQLSDTIICDGNEALLTFNAPLQYQFEWSNIATFDSLLSNTNMLKVKPSESTIYYVRVTNGKCQTEDEKEVAINSNPIIDSCEINDNHQLVINARLAYGNGEYDFGEGFVHSNVLNDVMLATTYTIRVKDELGCMSDIAIFTKWKEIEIPEFFTPNGDGINDTWEIGKLSFYKQYTLAVYDRFGKKVFESVEDANCWNGTCMGHDMPSTDYWYSIHIHDVDRVYSGHFTLIR